MKFKFRVTLLTILLGLSLIIVAALGVNSYISERGTAHDLASQVLVQTSRRIYEQLEGRLRQASAHVDLFRRLIESGRISGDNFTNLASIWIEELDSRTSMSRYSIALEQTGDWLYVRRVSDGRIAVGETSRSPKTGDLELKNYWAKEYPTQPFAVSADKTVLDARRQPWYTEAKAADQRIWTESYLIHGNKKVQDIQGITCAGPVHDANGKLQAVVAASLDLYHMCLFLKTIPIGNGGFAFIVELRHDGSRRVVAYPDPAVIFGRDVSSTDSPGAKEIIPVDECPDPRVRAFLAMLPTTFAEEQTRPPRPFSFHSEGERLLGSYHYIPGEDGPRGVICIVLPEIDVMGNVYRTQLVALGIGVAVLLTAILLSLSISTQVASPLEKLVAEANRIGQFHVQPGRTIESIVLEVDQLARATETMKASLRSFRKYVPADLVRNLIASGVEARLGGEEREVTIFFCDLAGFTSISEGMSPQALVEQLGEYFRAFTEEVTATGGTVDKFIGDAVMAFWGAPQEMPDHALAACRAALNCQERLAKLRNDWRAKSQPEFHARIGINTGSVVVGNIGSEQRLNYTVIGDAVNIASRLEGLNKHYGTNILMSDSTYQAAAASLLVRPVDWVTVKGKKEGGLVYELLGLQGKAAPEVSSLVEQYRQALDAYRKQDWSRAGALFENALHQHPGDGPSEEMLRRCRRFELYPPEPDWNGIFHMESK